MLAAALLWGSALHAPALAQIPRAHVGGGFGFTPGDQTYGQLGSTAGVLEAGLASPFLPNLRATLDAGYFYYASTTSPSPILLPQRSVRWDASHVVTAMLGVELESPSQGRTAGYLLAGAGLGFVSIGDSHVTDIIQGSSTVAGRQLLRTALTLGLGARRRLGRGGLSLDLRLRWVAVETRPGSTTVFPLTIGLAF